jgi:hypothetical protein
MDPHRRGKLVRGTATRYRSAVSGVAQGIPHLTLDLNFIEILEKADQRKRERLLAATPDAQVRSASNAQVRTFNRGHVRHAHRWIFASEDLDWASELFAEPSVATKVLDLSTRDLMHFQSVAAYDPRIDRVELAEPT